MSERIHAQKVKDIKGRDREIHMLPKDDEVLVCIYNDTRTLNAVRIPRKFLEQVLGVSKLRLLADCARRRALRICELENINGELTAALDRLGGVK